MSGKVLLAGKGQGQLAAGAFFVRQHILRSGLTAPLRGLARRDTLVRGANRRSLIPSVLSLVVLANVTALSKVMVDEMDIIEMFYGVFVEFGLLGQ